MFSEYSHFSQPCWALRTLLPGSSNPSVEHSEQVSRRNHRLARLPSTALVRARTQPRRQVPIRTQSPLQPICTIRVVVPTSDSPVCALLFDTPVFSTPDFLGPHWPHVAELCLCTDGPLRSTYFTASIPPCLYFTNSTPLHPRHQSLHQSRKIILSF